MVDDEHLLGLLADELRPPSREPSVDRVAEVRARAAAARMAAAPAPAPAATARPRRGWWAARAAAGIAAALVLLAAGAVVASYALDGSPSGVVEYAGPVRGPEGRELGELAVRETGIGRVVELRTDALPVLPRGELYEVWFVAPGDRPERPRRISAGTFHPAPDGTTDVRLAAAADPARYPVLLVTAEAGDGDPDPSGVVVLRAAVGP